MKNLSNTKKVLLGAGILVAGYYAWKIWKSYEISERNKKTVSATVGATVDDTLSSPEAFTEA